MSTEEELGITEFLSRDCPGFSGLIKERFSDFNVYEVDKSGTVVHLDNQEIPKNIEPEIVSDPDASYDSLSDDQKLLISEDQFTSIKLLNLQNDTSSPDSDFEPVKINVSDVDKEGRREIHNILKKFSNIFTYTNVASDDGTKYIEASSKVVGKKTRRDWPQKRPKYLHFSLYKENMETSEAISLLANKVRANEKFFGFAGTKDRRGRTTQRVSVSMVPAQQVLGAARSLYKLEVGSFRYDKAELKLGDLRGNRFELAVRKVAVTAAALEPVMASVANTGFINYFGTQRFGTQGVPTHAIGKQLIMGNYKEVIELILQPRETEWNEALKECRKIWSEERDAKKALNVLRTNRKDRCVEGKLLYGLVKSHKNNPVGALEEIPRQQRSLYCHAYQSYVWNKVVSRRIRTHGVSVIKGDLVFKNKDAEVEGATKEDLVTTVENVDEFTINDVLIPIPGTKVKYPDNEVKTWFEECLAEDSMNLDSFSNSVKDYNLPGDYRTMIVRPQDVDWSLQSYSDPVQDLLVSDKQLLENRTLVPPSAESGEGKFQALILKFSLPSSSYATMALREIMKVETDRASMARMSADLKRASTCDTQTTETSDEQQPASKVPKVV